MKTKHIIGVAVTGACAVLAVGLVTAQPDAAEAVAGQITTPMITQGVKVELPETNSEVVDDPEVTLEITIDAQGQYFINLGESVAENPTPVPVEQIGDQVGAIMRANPTVPVFVNADASIQYGTVITLLSMLGEAGAREPRLITQPASLEP